MFKLFVILSLFLAAQGQLMGGFTDHPELIQSPTTLGMVQLAISELANSQNLQVTPVNVVSVATQVVNGVNFRVVFNAQETSISPVLRCTASFYQPISGTPSISSVNCA